MREIGTEITTTSALGRRLLRRELGRDVGDRHAMTELAEHARDERAHLAGTADHRDVLRHDLRRRSRAERGLVIAAASMICR